MIEGRHVEVFTDHKPLIYAFDQRSTKASPRQQRQLDYISQFVKKIHHIAGADNHVADTLSRVNNIDLPVIISTEDIATAQEQDDEFGNFLPRSKIAKPETTQDGQYGYSHLLRHLHR